MGKLTPNERSTLIRLYDLNGSSPTATLRAYRRETGIRDVCSTETLRKLVAKFERTSSVADLPRSGRPKVAEETVMDMALAVMEISSQNAYGESSTSAISNVTGVSKSTVAKILKKKLDLFPYRIQLLHKLENGDPQQRFEFAHQFLTNAEFDPQWLPRIIFGDEANFTLCGQVNTWNTRIWGEENPHRFIEVPLHAEKVTVWIGFSANFILDPYFYQEFAENGNLRSVTVNSAQYCEMLEDYVIPQLAEMEVLDDAIWMQDGSPAHTTRVVTDLLRREFGNNRVISRKFPLSWPARSPDLTPCDFFYGDT